MPRDTNDLMINNEKQDTQDTHSVILLVLCHKQWVLIQQMAFCLYAFKNYYRLYAKPNPAELLDRALES